MADCHRRVEVVLQRSEYVEWRLLDGLRRQVAHFEQGIVEAVELVLRLLDGVARYFQGLAIMRGQKRQADGLAAMALLQQLVDGEEVAERLRHLLGADLYEAVMHPDAGERRAVMGAAALRDLVLVVREDEVLAAAMDVESDAQQLLRHGRAFD